MNRKVLLEFIILTEIIIIFLLIFSFRGTSQKRNDICTEFYKIVKKRLREKDPELPDFVADLKNLSLTSFYNWSSDQTLLIELKKNYSGVSYYPIGAGISGKFFVFTSAQGFRVPFYGYHFSNASKKIVFTGDSHCFGWGLNFSDTFSYRLSVYLNNYSNKKEWETVNLAVPSYNLVQKVKSLETNLPKLTNPKIIVVQYDGDDLVSQYFVTYVNLEIPIFLREKGKGNEWYKFVGCMKDRAFDLYYEMFNESYLEEKYLIKPLIKLRELQQKYNISKVVIVSYWPSETDELLLKEYSHKYSWIYINIGQVLKNPLDYRLSDLDLHLNKSAHEEIAKALFKPLRNFTSCI